jgi:phosphoserine phosphatase
MKLYLFDLDGTLTDPWLGIYRAMIWKNFLDFSRF